jgi:hypothetical protein
MDALDALTIRKRRDILYNRATAPYEFLREALFQYVPPPPIPPPFVFSAPPPVPQPVNQGYVDIFVPPPDITGVKREHPDPSFGDQVQIFEKRRPNPPAPPPPMPPAFVFTANQGPRRKPDITGVKRERPESGRVPQQNFEKRRPNPPMPPAFVFTANQKPRLKPDITGVKRERLPSIADYEQGRDSFVKTDPDSVRSRVRSYERMAS